MSKIVKKMEYDALSKTLHGVRDMVLIAPSKVGSLMEYTFRKNLREKSIKLRLVKNTLARKVLEAQGVAIDSKNWSGPTLIAWGPESIKDLSKTIDALLKDIVKKDPKSVDKLKVKTAVADGQTVSMDAAMKMPTRLEAIGEIIGMIMGPASELASCLAGPGAQIASQIETISERKEETPAEAPAAEVAAAPSA